MRFRTAVVVIEMAVAAGLTKVASYARYVAPGRNAWTGVPFVRKALLLAIDDSRSPQETRMRLCWVLDAGLPPPLCNRELFDLDGNLIGIPDLFDPVAGLVGEYDGADHKDGQRHRRDVAREERFRDHGLEYFEVVGGDLRDRGLVVDPHAQRPESREVPASGVVLLDVDAASVVARARIVPADRHRRRTLLRCRLAGTIPARPQKSFDQTSTA